MNSWILALKAAPFPFDAHGKQVKAGIILRSIIDEVRTKKPELFKGITVSVGPKMSVMLAYIRESSLTRIFDLAESIQAEAETRLDQERYHWGIAGVVTRGAMTKLDIFGTSWNFEGRPAIAAARILAKLKPGVLAVEEEAWSSTILPVLGDLQVVPGKRDGEEFSVRIHSGIKFPATFEPAAAKPRSEERRVGKECRSRWSPYH